MNNYNNIKKMMNDIIIMNITTTMATYIKLQFNDNVTVKLSTSSFLFKQSNLLKSIDIEDDTTSISGASSASNNIPILCSSTYVVDENDAFIFNDKPDLSFMFTYPSNRFLEICKFLDIICYENSDTEYSEQFIIYVMTNIKEEINVIHYFMQPEIKSIMNYINNLYSNSSHNDEIISCTPIFYELYLHEYTEEVIKYNRIDIYNGDLHEYVYFKYVHLYDNHLTYMIRQTHEYNNYVIKISKKLFDNHNYINDNDKKKETNDLKELIEQGANVNYQNNKGNTILHNASKYNLEFIKYLIKHGANINIQNNEGRTILHDASSYNLEVIQYIVEECNPFINQQDKYGNTPLHIAAKLIKLYKKLDLIEYLVKKGADINIRNKDGYTPLHCACNNGSDIKVVKYFLEQGANVNLQNNYGDTILHMTAYMPNYELIKYIVDNDANVNLQNSNGCTALFLVVFHTTDIKIIKYLVEHGTDLYLKSIDGHTALDGALDFKEKCEEIDNSKIINYLRQKMNIIYIKGIAIRVYKL